MNVSGALLSVAAPVLLVAGDAAQGVVVLDTGEPSTTFGAIGFDLAPSQSVAVAFTPTDDVILDSVTVWMMNNNFDGETFPVFTLAVVNSVDDGGLGVPGDRVFEEWDLRTNTVGFDPRPEVAFSAGGTVLNAGTQYWLVGTSDAPEFMNPVWVWGTGQAINAVDNAIDPGWNAIDGGATPSVRIEATIIPAPTGVALGGIALFAATRRRRA